MFSLALLLVLALGATDTEAKARFRTECERGLMYAIVDVEPEMKQLYLHRLKNFPDCQPDMRNNKAIFHLNLERTDVFSACGVTKVINRNTGKKLYYHYVMVEYESGVKESVRIECIFNRNGTVELDDFNRVKRAAQNDPWPSGFQEPEILEITSEITATAPTPELSVTVRQDGQVIDTSLNVRPGAALDMEIFLDSASSDTYGIIVSDMIVSDTKSQEEVLLINGCSVDPYLFGNFNTSNGDNLRANFRAFKFPETNYVLFRGILNVCIDKCEGVQCSNGEIGYGRRRRSLPASSDPNMVFQVQTSTILNVQFLDEETEVYAGFINGAQEPYAVGYARQVPEFGGARLTRRDGGTVEYPNQLYNHATIVRASATALLMALLFAV